MVEAEEVERDMSCVAPVMEVALLTELAHWYTSVEEVTQRWKAE
jgi:hypothetical protein